MTGTSCEKSSDFKLISKQKIADCYVLHSSFDGQNGSRLAVGLSNYDIVTFDCKTMAKYVTYKGHKKAVTKIKFSQENPAVLMSSSLDGNIFSWDTREGLKPTQTFSDKSDGPSKPITCFDFNKDEYYLCAGTELIREDSFLIFWDQRTTKCHGGYWNSHTDEITNVQFHATDNSKLASSSVDGLINIYDLTQTCELDALVNTLNAETSVINFTWGKQDQISLITGTEEYQFWSTKESSPSLLFNRKSFSDKYQFNIDYLIYVMEVENCFYVATGRNNGSVQLFCHNNNKLLDFCGVLKDGHHDIVRAICASKDHFATGSEDGNLCLWKRAS